MATLIGQERSADGGILATRDHSDVTNVLLQLLLMFVGILTYLEPELFLFITFYNDTFLIGNVLIVFLWMCECEWMHICMRVQVGVEIPDSFWNETAN
jgi:hypothetical protein